MSLKLVRPIIFFDLETTGTNITKDRIVEISLIKVMPDGTESEHSTRINPEMPIPAEATEIHHITDADVADKPTFKSLASKLVKFFEGCDLGGFNSNRFDIPMLIEEFRRAGITFDISRTKMVDVQTIYHKREPRTLSAAYKFYCGKNLDEAHSASADTRATYEVLKAQLQYYGDLPTDIDGLAEYSSHGRNVDFVGRLVWNDDKKEVINFGKHKGKLAEQVLRDDPGYYGWIMQGDFPQNTKNCFARIHLRVENAKRNK